MDDRPTGHRASSLLRAFTEHPASVGETYAEHLAAALGFSLSLARAAVCCAVHAFLPFLFTQTGSRTVTELAERMSRARRSRIGPGQQTSSPR